MCGIFAYYGQEKKSVSMVIEGLKKLEYRGYDSWGVAAANQDDFFIKKAVGKIGSYKYKESDFPESKMIMGHSRWATHGGVTEINAHPHSTENNEIVLIHNGIIDNYLDIKKNLVTKGHIFISETDTEVLAHLIQEYYEGDLAAAVQKSLKEIKGRYAILVMAKDNNKLIAARRGSPLIIGVNKKNNEYFIASDVPAFLQHTKSVIYLDDNQMAQIDKSGIIFKDLETDKQVEKRVIEVSWNNEEAEKGKHKHFMIKEILEQKNTLKKAIDQDDQQIIKIADEIKKAFGTYLVGCGTAGKVCLTGTYFFAEIAKKHINFEFGSEFPYFKDFIREGSLLIVVSQSGETADTLEAIEAAKSKGAKILAIVNVESSTMAREADHTLLLNAGPEKAVASTKATTAQLAILYLLSHACNGGITEGKQILVRTAAEINDMLNPRYEEHISKLAEKIKSVESMYIIGRGSNYPMALEAAIKLQEVSYIHAEGFAGGELKHGPIALITKGTPCIALVANDETKSDIISNATEIKSRGGYIIGIAPENNDVFDYWIKVPDVGTASPIVNIIPIQILAYQLAVLRQNNPDMPRNLAKSVTVK